MQILIPLPSLWHVLEVSDALLPTEIWPGRRVKFDVDSMSGFDGVVFRVLAREDEHVLLVPEHDLQAAPQRHNLSLCRLRPVGDAYAKAVTTEIECPPPLPDPVFEESPGTDPTDDGE